MLVNTNDAFFGIDTARLSSGPWARRWDADAYDAGSEGNNEDCEFVPGPACDPMSGNKRYTAGAEGFVYVGNGIHGIGDLGPSAYDWRNPVARVTAQRVR